MVDFIILSLIILAATALEIWGDTRDASRPK